MSLRDVGGVKISTCISCGHSVSYVCSLDSFEETLLQLRTAYVPSPSGRQSIDSATADAALQLQRIDAEVNCVSAVLNELSQAQKRLCTFISHGRGLLSPIRKLPIELLGLVFTECINQETNVISNIHDTSCVLPALDLSQVNHHWRSVARRMPSIWSKFDLVIGRQDAVYDLLPPRQLEPLLDTYLQLSSPFPLDLHIGTGTRHDSDIQGDTERGISEESLALLASSAAESHRWQTLSIDHNLSSQFPGVKGNLPMLEEVVHLDSGRNGPWPVTVPAWFACMPSLRKMTLRGLTYDNDQNRTPRHLDIPKVQEIQLGYADVASFLDIATMDIPLHVVTIGNLRPSSSNLVSRTFKDLRTLRLRASFSPALTTLFTYATMPALKTLELEADNESWSYTTFTSFISRSSCSLHSLSLQGITMSEAEMILLLPLFPLLVSLTLKDTLATSIIGSKLVRAIKKPGLPHSGSFFRFLPDLRVLELETFLDSRDFEEKLISMLKERTNMCLLKDISIAFKCREPSYDCIDEFSALTEIEGISLKVTAPVSNMNQIV